MLRHFNVRLTVLTALFLPLLSGEIARAAEAPEAEKARRLVEQLSSNNYAERTSARNALMDLGRPAIEPLEHAVKSEDPEVRFRAMELLIAMRGRGFLGIGLRESTEQDVLMGAVPADESDGDIVTPPTVIATQIVNFRQYQAYGVTKPLPAEAAEMQPGDKILAVNERPITGVKDLMREVITVGPARTAILLIERGGQRLRVPVTLTRNRILLRQNEWGGIQQTQDPAPPVDLEREQDERGKQTYVAPASRSLASQD